MTAGAGAADSVLEARVQAIEQRLAALGEALRSRDNAAVDTHAGELHQALSKAVDHFALAARHGPISSALRRRLSCASGEVAAQRESLARATAALDRAIDVLLPREAAGLYSGYGGAERGSHGGMIRA